MTARGGTAHQTEVDMSISNEMYRQATAELRRFLEEGNKHWLGYVSSIHLLLSVARDIAREDVEAGFPDYWPEVLQEYADEYANANAPGGSAQHEEAAKLVAVSPDGRSALFEPAEEKPF